MFNVWESGLRRLLLNIQSDTSQEVYTLNNKHQRAYIPNENLYIVLASIADFVLVFVSDYSTEVIQGGNENRGLYQL